MSVELIRKPITLDEMTRRESVQVIKERDIIVPDGKPDMKRILQLDGKVNIDQLDVSQDRILYRGKIDILVLYTTENNESNVYTMKGNIPLEDFVILEGVDKDQRIDFEYDIEHMSYNILNERKLNVKAIMQLDAAATRSKQTTVICGIDTEAPIQTREEEIEVITLGTEKEDRVIVREDLTVMQAKPSIAEILKSYVQIQEEQVKRTEAELMYNGILEVSTMYKAGGGEDTIEIINHRIPFEGRVDLPKDDGEVFWDCTLSVAPSYMQVAPDYDGEDRVIESEFIVTAKYYKFNKTVQPTICDLHCPGKKVSTSDKVLEYMNLHNRVHLSIPKKEAIMIENFIPENNEVFSVVIRPNVEEKLIADDKLTIKGVLEVKTIYIAKEVGSVIDTAVNIVPFAQEIEVKGIAKKASVVPRIMAKDVKIYSQGKKEVVVEYMLDSTAEIYTKGNLNVLEEISLEDMTKEELDQYPSMTVYQVKKGDSLWELAKRFNTSVKDIQEINGIDMPDALHTGQKIIILKKVKF
ncbi:DUF3794 and LysM peptidoglycan-binding domain-containing protein [Cellulosilyticum sp. I15G10I2]|uniref:DUF3794 and LysM peptidoglycan-binding domain-containing protein n=1 Tax=Cellulosilyticum sp. I15G10I2 TaxID=1892843 RepID=UPI00085C8C98|nr:SPOCS domain-containing protein [Cellulosilyticum sp. I15G10I2]